MIHTQSYYMSVCVLRIGIARVCVRQRFCCLNISPTLMPIQTHTHAHMHTRKYIHIHIHIHKQKSIHIRTTLSIRLSSMLLILHNVIYTKQNVSHLPIGICMYVYMYVCSVCVYVYVHVCMYVCMCVCICTYICNVCRCGCMSRRHNIIQTVVAVCQKRIEVSIIVCMYVCM